MNKHIASLEFLKGSQFNCFGIVNWPLLGMQGSGGSLNVLKIETFNKNKKHFYISSSGSSQGQSKGFKDTLRLHAKFASSLGLKEGDTVSVGEVNIEPIFIQNASVSCISADDWEILESNSEIVRNNILNQIRVIFPGLQFPFWITKSLSINLKIESISPSAEFGILIENSEIIIPSLNNPSSTSSLIPALSLKNYLRLRVHPISLPDALLSSFPSASLLIKNLQHAFIHKDSAILRESFDEEGKDEENMDKIVSFNATLFSRNDKEEKGLKGKVFLIEECDFHVEILKYFPVTNPSCIYLHPELILKKGIQVKSYIWIRQEQQGQGEEQIESHLSLLGNPMQHELDCRNLLYEGDDLRFGSYILQECIDFLKASLSLGEIKQDFKGIANGNVLIEGKEGSGKTTLASQIAQALQDFPYFVHWEIINCSKWRGKKAETIEKDFKCILEEGALIQPTVLVLDDLDVLVPMSKSEQVNLQEEFLHFKLCETVMDCLMGYKGRQLSVIATALSKEGLNSYWKSRQGFHFFQKIVSIPPPNQLERLSIFQKCLGRYQKQTETGKTQRMGIKKSDSQSKSTNETLTGHHSNSIEEPLILQSLSKIHDQYATPQLIHNIARKWAIHQISTWDEIENSNVKDVQDMFDKLVSEETRFCEESSGGGGRSSSSEVKQISWDRIGGLNEVKKELSKILEWPIKYAKLFKNAPIKLPSGILFYGYPGTGKTLMGLAITSLVNAKFIHIKGPELLSKYIGASEQAVQDVFKRARNCSPCIIFFDEFDSLVPRRGHDSTGVTDRVVNQFLAEMDGIEGGLGKGVYLIGATSRPDLIDPAVLRPGRLDKHLFFDFPKQGERKEILKGMGVEVNLIVDESDLNEIGHETEGFSGADLYALVSSAQLAAVQRYLYDTFGFGLGLNEEAEGKGDGMTLIKSPHETTTGDVPVKVSDLKEILSTFKPSLQGNELRKFKQIYENFSGVASSSSTNKDSSLRMETGKRATLA